MRQQITIILLAFLTFSCNTDKNNFIVMTEDQYKTIDGKNLVVSQTIKSLRVSDSLPVCTLTKVFNYNNDTRLNHLTGLSKEDGLQDYLMDSLYYDSKGNDTLKRIFVHLDNHWHPTQIFRKKFRPDNQVVYFLSERPYQEGKYYKKEIIYRYNVNGQVISEAEFECSHGTCDSIYKKEYVYNLTGSVDSTVSYWKNNKWTGFKKTSSP